jgi:hypothetical protein
MHGQEDEKAGKQTCQQTTMKHNNAEFSHGASQKGLIKTTQPPQPQDFFFKSQPKRPESSMKKVKIRVSSR